MEPTYINIETGETFGLDADDDKISEAYRAVIVDLKKKEKIAEKLKQAILDRVRPGDTRFNNFWEIQTQIRNKLSFPDRETEKAYRKTISEFSKQYQEEYELTIIKFPKF